MLLILAACALSCAAARRYGARSFDMLIGPMDGTYFLYADQRYYREDHLHAFGLDVPGQPHGPVRVVGRVAKKGQSVSRAFAMLGRDLRDLTLSQGHIRELIDSGVLRTTSGPTADQSQTALVLVTPGDEPATDDLSNLYVLGITCSPKGSVVVFPRKFRCTQGEARDGCVAAEGEDLSSRFQIVGAVR